MIEKTFFLVDELATVLLGQRLGQVFATLDHNFVVYLQGELGAGKTTLSRAIIQSMGFQGNVKSPTYSLVEEYYLAHKNVFHFDLYRLSDPEELEFIGLREYFRQNSLCLLEWAEKGGNFIPPADLLITLTYQGNARQISLTANSAAAEQIICTLSKDQAK